MSPLSVSCIIIRILLLLIGSSSGSSGSIGGGGDDDSHLPSSPQLQQQRSLAVGSRVAVVGGMAHRRANDVVYTAPRPKFLQPYLAVQPGRDAADAATSEHRGPVADEPERPDREDEQPQVVVLRPGDLTADEAAAAAAAAAVGVGVGPATVPEHAEPGSGVDGRPPELSGRHLFRRPARSAAADDDASSAKRQRPEPPAARDAPVVAGHHRTALLSFGDADDDAEGDGDDAANAMPAATRKRRDDATRRRR